MRSRRKRCERRRGDGGAKAVIDPQNLPCSLPVLPLLLQSLTFLLSSSSGGAVAGIKETSLTVNRIRGRTSSSQTCQGFVFASVCKGWPNNSWPVFFTKSQWMVVCACVYVSGCERFLAHIYTSVAVVSLQRLSPVCMWPFQGFSLRLLIKALLRQRPAGPGLASLALTIILGSLVLALSSSYAYFLFTCSFLLGICLSYRLNLGFLACFMTSCSRLLVLASILRGLLFSTHVFSITRFSIKSWQINK